ncbi:MAG: tetratricopeptide repeat protein [Methanoregula sp.]|nr:tetratricopeptide repeat protein [Methanoregula sp.]
MTDQTPKDQKKVAFRLFEEGRYQESLQICTALSAADRDAAVEVLTATNLYYTRKPEDAEVCFRDLLQKMPDSSYVHSYLGKILEGRGDEGAIAEYATAVNLDPTNQDALRSYAEYLLIRRDYHGALPVLRRLVQLAKKPDDVQNLMRAFIEIGDADEALALQTAAGGESGKTHEYIDALAETRHYREAAELACRIYRETKDPAVLRKYLNYLSRYDMPASLAAYPAYAHNGPNCDILSDFIILLKSAGDYTRALDEAEILLSRSPDPVSRMVRADLLAALGRHDEALASYEHLVRDELRSKNDLETLGFVIAKYRRYLMTQLPADSATGRFISLVSRDINVASLLETARLYEDQNNETEARGWYYRAYRTDYLAGGLAYARFLSAHGDDRECEKVMLYILSNVKKGDDLVFVASVILDELGGMFRLKRLMDQLVKRLEDRRSILNSRGLELLAMAFFITASNALEETDYPGCKYYCLCGMDVIPACTTIIQPEDFLRLIRTVKEKSVADRPIMNALQAYRKPAAPAPSMTDQLGLDEREQKIVLFLRSHRKATEMELRTLLSTRRVVGIVNRLVQKAAQKGVHLIEKKGVGENGEIYEYTGT